MKKMILSFLFCLLFNSVPAQEINEYNVYKTSKPIIIDGILNEPQWQEADWTKDFVVYSTGLNAQTNTKAKLLWDDNFLYIAIKCFDPSIIAKVEKHDGPLWSDDVVEVYIDPDGDGLNYIEFDINPLGAVTDILMNKPYFQGGKGNYKWNLKNPQIGIKIYQNNENEKQIEPGWVCEIALPFASIAESESVCNFPPQDQDNWRINLYRYDQYQTDNGIQQELTAWNQVDERGFHVPEKFGRIIFFEKEILTKNK